MLSRELQRSMPVTKVRRRSEIDRRLDVLVPAGRLKEAATTTIVKVTCSCGKVCSTQRQALQAGGSVIESGW